LILGSADGGDVNLTTGNLTIRDGAEVTTRSEGQGKAGDISANVRNNLRLSRGNITATSLQAGGGNINLNADDTRLSNSSLISTSVKESTGGGGNIRINTTVFLAIEDSDILANAEAGPGGDIFIKSEAFLADIFSRRLAEPVGRNPGDFARFRGNDRVDISADSRLGRGGSKIYPDIEQIRAVAELPADLVDPSELIDRRCTPAGSAKKSSFTITGRGGLPPNPNNPLTNQDVWVDWITLEETESNGNGRATDANSTPSKPQQLVEAQGWIINDKGQVVLIAQAPTVTPSRPRLELPPCEDNQITR
jgi:large exoprotein involved in heme utilization and adhesion